MAAVNDADLPLPTATTTEARNLGADVAVLPVGSFEQHGPFLPLTTDTLVATALAARIADTYRLLALPPVTISCSHEHAAWAGTVSISAGTLSAVVGDVAESLQRSGVSRLAVVNGHGGNHVLANTVQEASRDGRRLALFPDLMDWESARERAGIESSLTSDMHAGEAEVSVLLHTHPTLLRDGYASSDHTADDRRHLHTHGMTAYTDTGVIGHPSLATAAKGEALLAHLVELFQGHLTALHEPPVKDTGSTGDPHGTRDNAS